MGDTEELCSVSCLNGIGLLEAEKNIYKIGFGGGCHWCTEAVFQFVKGVSKVEQGWISSTGKDEAYSEAVLLEFNPEEISLEDLVAIHLSTHSSFSNHPMRKKYRSAIYYFTSGQQESLSKIIGRLQESFEKKLVTRILPFADFKINKEEYLNYYQKNNENSFCAIYIEPKLGIVFTHFSDKASKALVKNKTLPKSV